MTKPIPKYPHDIFTPEAVRNAREVDNALREFAPVVRLPGEDVLMLARFEHVSAGLKDWKSFSSTSRPWHDPDSVRPELLLTDDPPRHTRVRAVISKALSPAALNRMAENFRADARTIITQLREHDGGTVDAVADITQAFVYKVLPDLIGLPEEGRQHMSAFGHMVWATMGPMNALFHEAMRDTSGEVVAWAGACTKRDNLATGSLGMAMYEAADAGEVTPEEAELLVGILLSAAADTTVITPVAESMIQIANEPPSLVKAAFEESLRWDSPSRMAGRIAMRDMEVEDYLIPQGTRCGLMFAAANRDPRRWPDPYRFDVKRAHTGHLGFGFGVHACVGRVLALLEAEALLGAVAESVTHIEAAGPPEPWMTTIGHGPARLPVRLRFA